MNQVTPAKTTWSSELFTTPRAAAPPMWSSITPPAISSLLYPAIPAATIAISSGTVRSILALLAGALSPPDALRTRLRGGAALWAPGDGNEAVDGRFRCGVQYSSRWRAYTADAVAPSALRRAAASLSLSVTGSATSEEGGGDDGGGSRRRGAGTAAVAAPAGALNGRQYHQLDMDMMVWTAELLDCRDASDS